MVGDVVDPVPSSGHVVVRSLSAGICGSDLHTLADFGHFTVLMESVGVPALDSRADCVFGHEFCAEIVEHGPDTAATLPVGTRVCSVPIILGPTGVEQIGYSNSTRARWPSTWCCRSCCCCRCPTRWTPNWPR